MRVYVSVESIEELADFLCRLDVSVQCPERLFEAASNPQRWGCVISRCSVPEDIPWMLEMFSEKAGVKFAQVGRPFRVRKNRPKRETWWWYFVYVPECYMDDTSVVDLCIELAKGEKNYEREC